MIATQPAQVKLSHGPLTVAVVSRMFLEATVAIGTLAASAWYFGVAFDGPYIILSLLVFSLTFPGKRPRGASVGAMARDVLSGWVLIVGLLLMLGWATLVRRLSR